MSWYNYKMKPELLLPAGNIEKMEYAFAYGADAVYLGMVDFSLRTMRKGELITEDNLKAAISRARELDKKVYLTLNIFAFDDDLEKLNKNLEIIKDANPHAIILSDFGVYKKVREFLPDTDIHISTQTNTLNSEAVKFWQDLGAKRVILARELSLKQIEKIKKNCPDMELECFVHGSQCVSFSGRCLLSDFMTKNERKANQGGCTQPCRWSYKLVESTRPDEYYEICHDNHGSHILSPKDLCLIEHLKDLWDVGVSSFKVEGRTKSLYYVSATAKAYRAVLDGILAPKEGFEELKKVGNRGYTKGFFLGANDCESYSYDLSKGLAGADFLCIFLDAQEGFHKVQIKNKICLNDEIEIITPDETLRAQVLEIQNEERNESLCVANTNDIVWLKLSVQPKNSKYALGRTVGIRDKRLEELEGVSAKKEICEQKCLPLKGYAGVFKGKIKPDLNLDSIFELEVQILEEMGIKAILFDLDSTIVQSRTGQITPQVQNLLFELSKKFKMAVISNNYDENYVNKVQSQTKIKIYGAARKPDISTVRRALIDLNTVSEAVLMVGDRPLTDILCGKNAGMKTCLVDSISKTQEGRLTRFARKLERIFITKK